MRAVRRLLLVEPQSLWRCTLGATVRQLGFAEVDECLRVEAARGQLARQDYDALVLSLEQGQEAMALLEGLRAGKRQARIPVIVLAERCDAELALRLQALQVHRLLLKPFRLRQVLLAVAAIWPGLVPADELEERW